MRLSSWPLKKRSPQTGDRESLVRARFIDDACAPATSGRASYSAMLTWARAGRDHPRQAIPRAIVNEAISALERELAGLS